MSNYDIDKIINNAFEESDIEAWIEQDSQAQKELQNMQALRYGLKSLGNIPECQFSKERLRLAIDSAPIAKNSVKLTNQWVKWLTPGLAVACLGAFAVYSGMFKPQSPLTENLASKVQPQPKLEINDQTVVATDTSNATRSTVASLLDRVPQITNNSTSNSSAEPVINRSASQKRTRSTSIKTNSANSNHQVASENGAKVASDASTKVSAKAAPANLAAPSNAVTNESSAAENNVVVVESNVQPETNTARAVEMQKDDIVFGG